MKTYVQIQISKTIMSLPILKWGEMEIVLSWVEANKDQVNYIQYGHRQRQEACLKILGDYLSDEETFQKKHFRWL